VSFGAVIFTLVVLAVGMLLGAFANEHANRPELTQDELFDAMDRISLLCQGDYDHTRALLDELHRWMSFDGAQDDKISKELSEIIEAVTVKNDKSHGKY